MNTKGIFCIYLWEGGVDGETSKVSKTLEVFWINVFRRNVLPARLRLASDSDETRRCKNLRFAVDTHVLLNIYFLSPDFGYR